MPLSTLHDLTEAELVRAGTRILLGRVVAFALGVALGVVLGVAVLHP